MKTRSGSKAAMKATTLDDEGCAEKQGAAATADALGGEFVGARTRSSARLASLRSFNLSAGDPKTQALAEQSASKLNSVKIERSKRIAPKNIRKANKHTASLSKEKATETRQGSSNLSLANEAVESSKTGIVSERSGAAQLPLSQSIFFAKFPFEVRNAIWNFAAIPCPRLITVSHSPSPKVDEKSQLRIARGEIHDSFYWRARADAGPVPAMLHVNSEARAAAKKQYCLEFLDQTGGRPIYANLAIDFITFLDPDMAIHAFYGHFRPEFAGGASEIQRLEEIEWKIQHLAIKDWGSEGALEEMLDRLCALKSVAVCRIPPWCNCDDFDWDPKDHFPFEEWAIKAQSRGVVFKEPTINRIHWAELEAKFK